MKMEKWKFRHPRYSSKSDILVNAGDIVILLLAVLIVGFPARGLLCTIILLQIRINGQSKHPGDDT
jgi:hypothetical protein